jgi:hypothetical protein
MKIETTSSSIDLKDYIMDKQTDHAEVIIDGCSTF